MRMIDILKEFKNNVLSVIDDMRANPVYTVASVDKKIECDICHANGKVEAIIDGVPHDVICPQCDGRKSHIVQDHKTRVQIPMDYFYIKYFINRINVNLCGCGDMYNDVENSLVSKLHNVHLPNTPIYFVSAITEHYKCHMCENKLIVDGVINGVTHRCICPCTAERRRNKTVGYEVRSGTIHVIGLKYDEPKLIIEGLTLVTDAGFVAVSDDKLQYLYSTYEDALAAINKNPKNALSDRIVEVIV